MKNMKNLRERIADTPDKRNKRKNDDERPNVSDFIEKHGLYLVCEEDHDFEPEDEWQKDASHWIVKLKSTVHKGKFKTHYHMGSAHTGEPEIEGFLESIAMDINYPHWGYEFEEFCGNCGYDEDSRKAHKIWDTCCEHQRRLVKFLGPAAVDDLCSIEF